MFTRGYRTPFRFGRTLRHPRIGIGRFGCADRSQLDLPGSMVAAALHVPQGWDQTLGMEDTRPGKPRKNDGKIHHFFIGKSTISTGPFSIVFLCLPEGTW